MWLELRGQDWRSGPVRLVSRFWDRWRGLLPYPGHGLLLAARSVHGLGLRVPLLVVGIDRLGEVKASRTLEPGRICYVNGACWILELPSDRRPPREGEMLHAYRRP